MNHYQTFENRFFKLFHFVHFGLLTILTMACGKDPKTYVPGQVDSFIFDSIDSYQTAAELLQADYLVALDPSFSSLGNVNNLRNSIKNFTQALRDEGIDYRLGFINGSTQSTYSLATKRSKLPSGFLVGLLSPQQNFSIEDNILSNLALTLGENEPWHLEASWKVLNAQKSSFIRPGAQLVLVFIADSDDQSNPATGSNTAASYATRFKSLKPNPAYVSARAIIYSASISCPATGIPGTSNAPRIEEATKLTDSIGGNPTIKCITNDFSTTLSGLATNVTKPTKRFLLQTRIVPGSLNVSVNGVTQSSSVYVFNSSTNEVVFNNGQEPGFNQSVTFTFDPWLGLSHAPNPSTIAVTVNGNSVPQSASNGFLYVASENRIVLTGSAAVQGAEVKVSYQIAGQ